MDERILVVDRDLLFNNESLAFQGLLNSKKKYKEIMKNFKFYKEVRRGDAEQAIQWKQPIPSVVITRGDEVFLYKRLSAGGEARLHDNLSITIGGHMNRVNDIRDWYDNLFFNMYRELEEEVNIVSSEALEPEIIGLINDESNDVGKVHIGILFVLDLPEDAEVTVRETNKLEGYWVRAQDLVKSGLNEALENWSKLVVEVL